VALVSLEVTLWVSNPMHVPTAFVTARAFGVQMFQEPGASMQPVIPEGNRVLISSWPYWWGEPRLGDIIAFVYPNEPSVADLKRVIAVPGSSIEIRGAVLYLDGKPAPESILGVNGRTVGYPTLMLPRRIPAGSYFVMGDNRGDSIDSRSYGLIRRDQIIGKLWF
jgi:signal peptidase I